MRSVSLTQWNPRPGQRLRRQRKKQARQSQQGQKAVLEGDSRGYLTPTSQKQIL